PFPELIARVHALARRTTPPLPPALERHGITLDPAHHKVYRDGAELPLTPKEFAVLQALMRAQGNVVSAGALLVNAWDGDADPFTNFVRVTVMTLRKKLGDPPVVHTVPGAGYRL